MKGDGGMGAEIWRGSESERCREEREGGASERVLGAEVGRVWVILNLGRF